MIEKKISIFPFVYFLIFSGQVYSLGRKEYGRLGLGENCEDVSEPALITALKDKKVTDISCEGNVSYAVTEDGKIINTFFIFSCSYLASVFSTLVFLSGEVYSWGMGSNMQLGMGDDDTDLWVPTKIKAKALENKLVKVVSAGGQHTVLLASDTTKPVAPPAKAPVANGRPKKVPAKKAAQAKKAAEPEKEAEPEKAAESDKETESKEESDSKKETETETEPDEPMETDSTEDESKPDEEKKESEDK